MKRIMVMMLLLIGCAFTASAGGYNYVEQAQFKQWLEKGKDMTIVDIQVPAEFQQHHFKAALETGAFPVKSEAEKQKLDAVLPKLSAAKNDVVVVCPRGGGGAKNTIDYLKEKGIDEKRIFILKEGMQGWPYKDLAVAGK
ncbi:MAG TPA: rhodanese-like domain-containing protein [Dongiaceae bacterium]|nr:rhodanese-like domain-containing protein [Dongiaceae bacterium]